MKRILLFGFLFISILASANGPGDVPNVSVEGKVLDASNAEGLTGATVYIKELDLRVYASFDGSFSLGDVPAGTYTVEVSYVSYDRLVYKNWEIKPGKAFKKFFLTSI